MSVELQHDDGDKLLRMNLSGKLTKEDYGRFVPEVDRFVREHGPIRLLCTMHEFHGWRIGALWEDCKFAFRHFRDFQRIALVGERRWEAAMAVACKPFTKAKVRYFDASRLADATAWVQAA